MKPTTQSPPHMQYNLSTLILRKSLHHKRQAHSALSSHRSFPRGMPLPRKDRSWRKKYPSCSSHKNSCLFVAERSPMHSWCMQLQTPLNIFQKNICLTKPRAQQLSKNSQRGMPWSLSYPLLDNKFQCRSSDRHFD